MSGRRRDGKVTGSIETTLIDSDSSVRMISRRFYMELCRQTRPSWWLEFVGD